MTRPKKDGEKISLYRNKELMEKLRKQTNDQGRTSTAALERAMKSDLDLHVQKN